MNHLLTEERNRYDKISKLLEDTRLQSEREKTIFQDQLQNKEKQIEIEV